MLTRRQLLRRSAAGAAVMLLPAAAARAAVLREGRFRQGVLSGDPTPDGVTLLTLLDDVEGPGSVRLEVARDAAFRKRRRAALDHHQRRQGLLRQGARSRA